MKKLLIFWLIAMLVTSCAAIPTSGPINPGLNIGFSESLTNSSDTTQAPQPGMSKMEIVAGFLEANSTSVSDFSIAREYLASFIDFEWSPSLGIQVFETQLSLVEQSDGKVLAKGIPLLQIDQQLRPSIPSPDTPKTIEFSLVKENDEWRISNPPSGILISSVAFQRSYEISNLWFVDKTESRLVPDPIVLAQKIDPASQLIRALSAGSSSWLKPAVVNMLDFNLSGGLTAVQRQGDTINIDLDVRVLRMSDRQRALLASQILQTLAQISDLAVVQLTAGGQLLAITGIKNPINLTSDKWIGQQSNRSPSLFALSTDKDLFKPLSDQIIPSWISNFPALSDIAVMADGAIIAAYLPSKAEILFGSRNISPVAISRVSNLSNLNFGSDGTLWFVDRASRNLFWFNGTQLQQAKVRLATGQNLNHAAIGPDNVRLAVVSQSADQAELSILRIQRSKGDLEFVEPKRVIAIQGQVIDLNWYSATQLILLVNFPTQLDPVAIIVDIATAAQTISRLPAGTVSVDANGYQSLAASTRNGEIWIRLGSSWSEIGSGALPTFAR